MARMLPVEVGGQIAFEVEEGTPPDVIDRLVKQHVQRQAAGVGAPEMRTADPASFLVANPNVGGEHPALGGVKAVARGMLSATAALPGNSAEFVNNLLGIDPNDRFFPNTDELIRKIRAKTGVNLESPPVEKGLASSARSVGEGVGSSVLFPARTALGYLMQLGAGGAAGAAGDLGATVAGEEARGPAAILAGLLSQGYQFRTPNINKLLKGAKDEFSVADLRKAQDVANRTTATTGVPTPGIQGFDKPTSMEALWDELLQSAQGGRGRKVLNQQADAGENLATRMVQDTTSAGTDWKEANRVLGVADKAIRAPARARTEGTKDMYAAASTEMANPSTGRILADVFEKRRQELNLPNSSQGGDALNKGGKRMLKTDEEFQGTPDTEKEVPTGLLDAQGNAITKKVTVLGKPPERVGSPLDYASLAREAGGRADSAYNAASKGGPKNKAVAEAAVRDITKSHLRENYPSWAAAEDKFSELSGPVNEMKVSPMARTFPKNMRKEGVGDFTKFSESLNKGPDYARDVATKLREADPTGQAFMQIVKHEWQKKFDDAFTNSSGRDPANASGVFAASVSGRPGSTQRETFKVITEEGLRARGVNDPKQLANAVKIAEETADALMVITRGRGGMGRIDAQASEHAAGANWISTLMRTPGWLVGASPMAASLERVLQAQTYKKAMDMFLSVDGMDQLAKISQYSVGRNAVNQFARILIQGGATSAAHQDKTIQE